MPTPDDPLQNPLNPAQPGLRERINAAAPQAQANAQAVAQRLGVQPAPDQWSYRDKLQIGAHDAQADAQAVQQRLAPRATIASAAPQPAASPLGTNPAPDQWSYRDRVQIGSNDARADAQATAQRLNANPQPPRPDAGTVRQQLGVSPPDQWSYRDKVHIGSHEAQAGAQATAARLAANPQPPGPDAGTMRQRLGVPPPPDQWSYRDKVQIGDMDARADAKATAARLNANPQSPKPDVGTMRQQLGLRPTPPGAAPGPTAVPGPGAAATGAAGVGAAGAAAARAAGAAGAGTGAAAAGAAAPAAAAPAAAEAAGLGKDASLLARAAYGTGKMAGRAVPLAARALPVVGRAAPVVIGGQVLSHINDYKINDPDVDSSATGTVKALAKGDFAGTGRSLSKAALETLMDLGSAGANLLDYVVPGKAPVSTAYDKMLHDTFGNQLAPHPSVIADHARTQAPKPAAKVDTTAKNPVAAPAKPAAPDQAKPGAAPAAAAPAPAQAPARRQLPDYSGMAAAARDDALEAIDREEGASPNAAYYQTVNQNTGTTTYDTRDGNQIAVQAPTDRDRALVNRLSVIDGRPEAGATFEQDGKVYKNVVTGRDEVGKPVYRAISIDGAAEPSTLGNEAGLIRQYDEAQSRLAGPSQADSERIAAFDERQGRRDAVHQRYQQALDAIDAIGAAPTNAGPVADAARASANPNAKVAAFVQQYGDYARATGEKLGVDPNVVLAHWGQETGWGKSVIPGTNNLGNIKAVKGEAGVRATDNMTGSKDAYAQYGSPQEFTDKYAGLIQRRYTGAVGAGDDMGKFAAALSGGGYATDPDYANKLQAAYKTVRAAGGGMQPVAQDTLAATTAGPGAMNPRRVRGPLDNPVQIIDMPSGQVSMAFPRSDNPSAGMTQDDYTAARAALRQNPGLAQRMQVTANGLTVDGVPMPANVLLGGDAEITKFKKNVAQAQRVAVNPLEGRLAEEALRGEVANRGHQIAADASLGVADKNAASAEKVAKIQTEASLLQHRYLPAGGEVDEMGRKKPTVYYDTQPTLPPGKYVPLPQNVPAKAVAIQQAREALKRGGKLEDVNAILQGYGYEPITQ